MRAVAAYLRVLEKYTRKTNIRKGYFSRGCETELAFQRQVFAGSHRYLNKLSQSIKLDSFRDGGRYFAELLDD